MGFSCVNFRHFLLQLDVVRHFVLAQSPRSPLSFDAADGRLLTEIISPTVPGYGCS
jgi:hypothetical protein